MAFSVKDWHNEDEATDTPLDADGLEDMEARLSDYTGTFGANIELAYDERAYNFVAGSSAAEQVINDLSVTVEVTNRPIQIIFFGGTITFAGENGIATIQIKEGSTYLAGTTFGTPGDPSADTLTTMIVPVNLICPRYTTPGTHTFTVSIWAVAGNCTLGALPVNAGAQPMSLQVLQI